MQPTKIEWCNYTVNPVKGYCPMACPYCYARRMYDRFGWDKTIRIDLDAFHKGVNISNLKEPSRIFVGSTIELFGDWVGEDNQMEIIDYAYKYSRHTLIFLTKQPQNLQKWSPFPENCWVGVSVTNQKMAESSVPVLMNAVDAKVRFVSVEPFLEPINLSKLAIGLYLPERQPYYTSAFEDRYIFGDEGDAELKKINWLIIGAETGNRKEKPPLSEVHKWAKEIIKAADEAGIPVFLKDNLQLAKYGGIIRQEFPQGG